MDIRLMFWVKRELVSKFLCELVPQIGETWTVTKGVHQRQERKDGVVKVKVLAVEVTPYPDQIDIDVEAEYAKTNKPADTESHLRQVDIYTALGQLWGLAEAILGEIEPDVTELLEE